VNRVEGFSEGPRIQTQLSCQKAGCIAEDVFEKDQFCRLICCVGRRHVCNPLVASRIRVRIWSKKKSSAWIYIAILFLFPPTFRCFAGISCRSWWWRHALKNSLIKYFVLISATCVTITQ